MPLLTHAATLSCEVRGNRASPVTGVDTKMPDRSRSGALALVLTLATVAGCHSSSPSIGPAPMTAAASSAEQRGQTLTLTSDAKTAVVEVADARQLAAGVESVISSRVQGLEVVQDSSGVKLRIKGTQERGATQPLFIIDGVPVAEGFALSILARVVDRIDVFQDSATTKPYGLRGTNGVVLIATARRR